MTNNNIQQILKKIKNHEKRIRTLENDVLLVKKKTIRGRTEEQKPDNLILSIVNKIGECNESEEIQSKVLDKTSMEGKILLCFYISYKYFKNVWLTTGDIEKITSALGTKITVGNVSNKIKGELRKFLESRAVRKQGQPTPYRFNRKGYKRFEEILHSNN